jgi:hypothetical protein
MYPRLPAIFRQLTMEPGLGWHGIQDFLKQPGEDLTHTPDFMFLGINR